MTTTEIAVREGGALAVQAGQTEWSEQQLAVLYSVGIKKEVTKAELTAFLHECQQRKLDPFSKQIYLIGRYDSREKREVYRSQTGIDGFRVIAHRAAREAQEPISYEETLWCGPDGQWRNVWLEFDPPRAAMVVVLRGGQRFPAVATLAEYAATYPDGNPMPMWKRMPSTMLAKCAEALALRKAFPDDLSGIYTAEEMGQADNAVAAPLVSAERRASRQSPAAPVDDQWARPAPAAPVPADNIQDAEEVEPSGQASPPSPLVPTADQKQIAELVGGLRAVRGIDNPKSGLAAVSAMVRRDITHLEQLTKAEAKSILTELRAEDAAKTAAPSGPPPVGTPNNPGIGRPQMAMMQASLNEHGIRSDDDKHAFMTRITGRTIASANDLSVTEASAIIDALTTGEIPAPTTPPVARTDAFADLTAIIANVNDPQSHMDAGDAITEELAAGRINTNDADLLRERLAARVPQGVAA